MQEVVDFGGERGFPVEGCGFQGLIGGCFRMPLAGGAPVQLTHFDSEPLLVGAVAWSRDGKKVAISRRRFNTTDAVMISNFR